MTLEEFNALQQPARIENAINENFNHALSKPTSAMLSSS